MRFFRYSAQRIYGSRADAGSRLRLYRCTFDCPASSYGQKASPEGQKLNRNFNALDDATAVLNYLGSLTLLVVASVFCL